MIELHKSHDIVASSYGALPFSGPLDPMVHKTRARLEAARGSSVTDKSSMNGRKHSSGNVSSLLTQR